MPKQESRKLAKITSAIINYLFQRNYNKFDLKLNRFKDKTTIVLEIPDAKVSTLKEMIDKISKTKDSEVEMYGWELIGESGFNDELELLGMLIDKVEIEEKESSIVLTFYRTMV